MQLVQDVTHGKRILDKFLTNNADLFTISRCKIDALGIKTDDVVEIGNINAFFTNVATDPNYDVDNVRNIVNSYHCSHSTQKTNDISGYEIAMRLSKLKKTAPGHDDMPYLVFNGMFIRVIPSHNSYHQFVVGFGSCSRSIEKGLHQSGAQS